MRLTISWWDETQGIGIALTEEGKECLLHSSALSLIQMKTLKPMMIIYGELKNISRNVQLVFNVRTSKNFSTAAQYQDLILSSEAA